GQTRLDHVRRDLHEPQLQRLRRQVALPMIRAHEGLVRRLRGLRLVERHAERQVINRWKVVLNRRREVTLWERHGNRAHSGALTGILLERRIYYKHPLCADLLAGQPTFPASGDSESSEPG